MPFTTRGAALQRMWLYEDLHLTHIWSWAKNFPSFSHSHERASSLSGCLTDLCKIRNRARKKLLAQLMYSAGKARPHWKTAVSILVWLNGACRAQGLLSTTRSVTRMPRGTPGQLGEPQESRPGSAVFICTLLLNSHNKGMDAPPRHKAWTPASLHN